MTKVYGVAGNAIVLGFLLSAPGGALYAATSCAPKTIAFTNFTGTLGGWTSNTPAQIKLVKTGGDPGGYVQFTDETGDSTYIDAPSTFHGDYTALNNAGYITYQHAVLSETGVTGTDPYEVRLSGPGGAAKFDAPAPSGSPNGWLTIVAPLSAANWTVTSGTWSALLANITDLQIDIELVSNQTIPGDTDIEGIDDVAAIMLPCGIYTPKS